MLGGDVELIQQAPESLRVNANGENWLSLPFEVSEDGFYRLAVVKEGGGKWDIRIDGEKYAELTGLYLQHDGENDLAYPAYLEKGSHSIIFYSQENFSLHTWYFLLVENLSTQLDTCINTKKQWKELTGYSRILEIGEMFSGSYINVNIARDMALFTRRNYQYISFYSPEGFLVVGRRRLDSTYFEKYWLPIKATKAPLFPSRDAGFHLSDPHNFISMQMDGDGYLHLAYGHHNKAMKYMRTRHPYDISVWNIPEGPIVNSDEEKSVTYVRFIKLNNGNLLAMFRCGSSGRGYSKLLKYDLRKRRWSTLYSPFVTDYGYSSPYFWRPAVSFDGTVHLAWTWRLSCFANFKSSPEAKKNFSGFPNKNVVYAKSHDEGCSWVRSDGVPYKLPIDRASQSVHQAEIIEELPMGEGFFNHFGSDYDADGNPHFTYTRWGNSESMIPQQWHLYWDGAHWHSKSVSQYRDRFTWRRPQQQGRASTYLTRPSILIANDNTAVIISRSREFGNVIELFISSDSSYSDWRRFTVYDGPVGGWEPQVDLDLWHEKNTIHMLLLGITDKNVKGSLMQRRKGVSIKRYGRTIERALRNIYYRIMANKPRTDNLYWLSDDNSVDILPIDKRLKENAGYILEVDYDAIKGPVN